MVFPREAQVLKWGMFKNCSTVGNPLQKAPYIYKFPCFNGRGEGVVMTTIRCTSLLRGKMSNQGYGKASPCPRLLAGTRAVVVCPNSLAWGPLARLSAITAS